MLPIIQAVRQSEKEISEGRTWSGENAAKRALQLVENSLDSGDLNLVDALEIKNQIAELYFNGRLFQQVEMLDEEIENELAVLEDDDERHGFRTQVLRRRAIIDELEGFRQRTTG